MLRDERVPVRLVISALWVATMLCYVYGDIFNLFRPGRLEALMAGRTPVGPTTQAVLLAFAISMAIPSAMVFLTLVLRPQMNRWMNIVLGVLYTLIMLITMVGQWTFYVFLGLVEITLTALIVWYAWTWPKQETVSPGMKS